MDTQILLLQLVTVDSARGPIRRTVIAEIGDVIVLADPSRAEEAKMAGITRFSIGFRRSDVISVEGLDKLVLLKHNVQYEPAEHRQARPDPLDAL
jgi:hypothetical protein